MSLYTLIGTISDTSPSSATTAVGSSLAGLGKFDEIQLEAALTGGTGGTLDVYIQRKLYSNRWSDWVHFSQITAGAAVAYRSVRHGTASAGTIVTVGQGTDASPGVALAAGSVVVGHPGNEIRTVFVAGSSTTAGAAQVIRVYGLKK